MKNLDYVRMQRKFRIDIRAVSHGGLLEHTDIIAAPSRQVARMIVAMCDYADLTYGTRTYAVCVERDGHDVAFEAQHSKQFSREGRTR